MLEVIDLGPQAPYMLLEMRFFSAEIGSDATMLVHLEQHLASTCAEVRLLSRMLGPEQVDLTDEAVPLLCEQLQFVDRSSDVRFHRRVTVGPIAWPCGTHRTAGDARVRRRRRRARASSTQRREEEEGTHQNELHDERRLHRLGIHRPPT